MKDEVAKPATVSELAIHLGYIKSSLEEIKEQIKNIGTKFASQEEFIELRDVVKTQGASISKYLEDRKWVLGFIACLIFLQGGIIYFAKNYISNEIANSVKTSLREEISLEVINFLKTHNVAYEE